jgi:2-alkenal reductase
MKYKPFLMLVSLMILPMLACGVFTPSGGTPELAPVDTVVEPLPTLAVQTNAPVEPISGAADLETDNVLVELYRRVNPSVVNLTVYAEEDGALSAFSQGSGFVFDGEGDIITNAHVVHGATRIEVNFFDGSTRRAELMGEDLNSDLAVVRVTDLPAGIGALPLGSMEELAVGQSVVAIGNPFGLEGTLTRGIISALGRTIPGLTIFSIPQTIQTDAAINPGNSGGPLLNLRGEVIGVNAQIRTDDNSRSNSGVGFAIPVSIVQRVVPALIADGEYVWSWMGVQGGDVTLQLAEAMGLPNDRGAYIAAVLRGGPAAKAGLRGATDTAIVDGQEISVGGDVIVAVNGQPVKSFDDILVYIALNTSPGQEINLTVLRDGESLEIPLTLEPRPEN